MREPQGEVLTYGSVRLEPLTTGHADGLLTAAADGDVFLHLGGPAPGTVEQMREYIADAQAYPGRVPYAVLVDGQVAGTSSYYDVRLDIEGLEVGGTWYASTHWGGTLNPTCKLLLLGHAFEELGTHRVLLKTDALNSRSRAAIAKLGCSYDGTLRHDRLRADGTVRDSAYFSMLAPEWPGAKANLLERIA